MNCLCASTRHAARLLTRVYEESLAQADVTPAQFELLGTIAARPGLPQTKLAEALGLDQTTLSRNLRLLLTRKWVQRTSSSEDRRQAAYTLSEAGRRAWQRALPYWQRAQDHLHAKLGSDWQMVWFALDRLTKSAEAAALQQEPTPARSAAQPS